MHSILSGRDDEILPFLTRQRETNIYESDPSLVTGASEIRNRTLRKKRKVPGDGLGQQSMFQIGH
jgi:hypothetical protein